MMLIPEPKKLQALQQVQFSPYGPKFREEINNVQKLQRERTVQPKVHQLFLN